MANKTKKAQVVLAVHDNPSHTFHLLLLQTNQKRGAFWQNVTGKIEDGETFLEGALREAREETNLENSNIVDTIDLSLRFDFTDGRKRDVHEETFLFVLKDKWEVKIDKHEHQNWKWINLEELQEGIVKFESNFKALMRASAFLKERKI